MHKLHLQNIAFGYLWHPPSQIPKRYDKFHPSNHGRLTMHPTQPIARFFTACKSNILPHIQSVPRVYRPCPLQKTDLQLRFSFNRKKSDHSQNSHALTSIIVPRTLSLSVAAH
ncbi:hypothetical protein CEXT_577231 [Caerostris extrusa]|uniref:Uncharacterized protein n=1 Tax=Caerostris extrusa TaxID=172846 RepID=A0AAV4N733_CAEEX|nr:hypothetical protein CEXT_577231 [Caerostris extrusa]